MALEFLPSTFTIGAYENGSRSEKLNTYPLVNRACPLKSDREKPTLDFLLRGLSFKRRRGISQHDTAREQAQPLPSKRCRRVPSPHRTGQGAAGSRSSILPKPHHHRSLKPRQIANPKSLVATHRASPISCLRPPCQHFAYWLYAA